VKVFVQMMLEDICSNFEGFSWQKKVLRQSEENKKKKLHAVPMHLPAKNNQFGPYVDSTGTRQRVMAHEAI